VHENVLILVTKAKVNKLSICISIANVNLSVYLFSIDVLKLSKKMCIGYFNTVHFFYHTAEYIFKLINLWNENYLLPFTRLPIKMQYLYTHAAYSKRNN
jgi:homospermidine synthase